MGLEILNKRVAGDAPRPPGKQYAGGRGISCRRLIHDFQEGRAMEPSWRNPEKSCKILQKSADSTTLLKGTCQPKPKTAQARRPMAFPA